MASTSPLTRASPRLCPGALRGDITYILLDHLNHPISPSEDDDGPGAGPAEHPETPAVRGKAGSQATSLQV